ncbi:ATP-binding protein [Pseudoalteromonas sp. DY56-GL22]|uniref:alpha/beta hydrolase n=1 Tax=Pseudoalteromonas sp. DY56-GL22 TaxID=2967126 RepID=UPI003529EBE4
MKGWYEVNKSDTVIVFIHGLFSDSSKCWTSKCNVFWPDLILKEKRIFKPSIFLAEFYTEAGSNDYGISECAKEVHSQLVRTDEKGNSPPISKENIIFVTHSTGGIVARYILDSYRSTFRNKKVGLCLYASPSYGSKIPFLARLLSKLTNNQLAQELNWESDILKDIDDRFNTLLAEKSVNITGIEAFENRAPFRIPFINYRVVNKESAARYFNKRKLIPNSDHSSIVKPKSACCASHEFLIDYMTSEGVCLPINKKLSDIQSSLFNRYEPKYKDYTIVRDVDVHLVQTISQYSVWVCGESGTGKTTSIFRALYEEDIDFKYISLGSYIGSGVHELFNGILTELNEGEYVETHNIQDCIKKISGFISNKADEEGYFLFIEEIPISNNVMFIDFSNYIYALINSLINIDFKIALSSIYRPNSLSNELTKTSEVLKVKEWVPWSTDEIRSLINLIEKHTGIGLVDVDIDTFGGIPRHVKKYFKDELSKQPLKA